MNPEAVLRDMTAQEQRFVIGIDYGTTYTGVAYATPNSNKLPLEEISLIQDWGLNMDNHDKIPSVYSYSLPTEAMEQNWGSDLSEDAVAMIHTKLELDTVTVAGELELLIQALDGMKSLSFQDLRRAGVLPAFPDEPAEQIVTRYLYRVFLHLSAVIRNFSEELRKRVPVDIVITVPTEWRYRAKNSTYHAVTNAGFDRKFFPLLKDIIFVTEPEAAAIYTARHLKNTMGGDFLKPGECFVLCDAGGGTVDVVSYKVWQVEPSLELERVGIPTGDKCGAIYIDIAFKKWLRELLGEKHYSKLDGNLNLDRISLYATEGKAMRKLMKSFDDLKKRFCKGHRDMPLDLPPPLENLTLSPGVNEGEIIITYATIKGFFDQCVKKIIDLLEGHIRQIERLGKRTKNIFLVGGFGESKYLQQEIDFSLRLRNIKLRVPDTSWTAVVRGAVLWGIEKDTISNLSRATPCPQNFGICVNQAYSRVFHDEQDLTYHSFTKRPQAQEQLVWLMNKGDLVLSDNPHEVSHTITVPFKDNDPKKREIKIYSYPDNDHRPTRIQNSIDELKVSQILEYDLSDIPLASLVKSKGKNGVFYTAELKISLTLSPNQLESALSWGEVELATDFESWL